MSTTAIVNTIWAMLSVMAQAITLLLIVLVVAKKNNNPFLIFWRRNALVFSFIIAFLAMSGSLVYSQVLGYAPCELCWFQRIFMYPQVFLLGVALWRKEKMIMFYSLILSIIGALIALYHYLGQIGFTTLPCPAVGYSISCAKIFALNFSYVTIPMMAFSAFLLMIVTAWISLRD